MTPPPAAEPQGLTRERTALAQPNLKKRSWSLPLDQRRRVRIVDLHFPLRPPPSEKDFWKDAHDAANLIVLVPINALNVWFLVLWALDDPRKEHVFVVTSLVAIAYFILDLAWVVVKPVSVKSPGVIIWHHILALLYSQVPVHFPQCGHALSLCLLVEINTWFLIARRYWARQRLFSVCFYVTWVVIRVLLYPVILVHFVQLWRRQWALVGSPFNWIAVVPLVHGGFVAMNLLWTKDLILTKLQGKGVQKGL